MFRDFVRDIRTNQASSGLDKSNSQYDPSREYQTAWLYVGIALSVILSIDLGWLFLVLVGRSTYYATASLGIIALAILVLFSGFMMNDMSSLVWLFSLGVNGISIMSLFGIIFYQYLYIDPGAVLPNSIIELLAPCIFGIILSVTIVLLLLSPKIRYSAFQS